MLVPITSLRGNLRVVLVDCYELATVWALIEDGEGNRTEVCTDGRKDSKTSHRLFERARNPRKDGATLVPSGSSEEDTIIALLSRWCDMDEVWTSGGYRPEFKSVVQEALLRVRLCDPDD